jgi:hypothetical protein
MKKNAVLLFVLLLALTYSATGQVAIGYNTDGNTLSLSTNPMHKLIGEFRVNTKAYSQADWSYNDRGITQVYLHIKIFSSTNVSLYSGGGLGVNLLSEGDDKWLSVNIPVGLRMNPFSKFPDLFILGEYDPMIIISEGTPVIHCISLGFRYRLGKAE